MLETIESVFFHLPHEATPFSVSLTPLVDMPHGFFSPGINAR